MVNGDWDMRKFDFMMFYVFYGYVFYVFVFQLRGFAGGLCGHNSVSPLQFSQKLGYFPNALWSTFTTQNQQSCRPDLHTWSVWLCVSFSV